MLFKTPILEGIAAGRVTLAFRRWQRPAVKVGGTLKTAVGVLQFDAVDVIARAAITARDAKRAGFESRAALLDDLGADDGRTLYRMAFTRIGDDPRVALRKQTTRDAAARTDLEQRLARYDAAAATPWTTAVLQLIADHPTVAAAVLARKLGADKDAFKINVRKLKELGLTESLETGYRLSPRGKAFLAATTRKRGTGS
jgi:hypothetical protein